MSIRLDDLTIPDFANTEEAEAWGRRQDPKHYPILRAVYRSLESIALKTNDLQRKANYATDAQLIREAAQALRNAALIPEDATI